MRTMELTFERLCTQTASLVGMLWAVQGAAAHPLCCSLQPCQTDEWLFALHVAQFLPAAELGQSNLLACVCIQLANYNCCPHSFFLLIQLALISLHWSDFCWPGDFLILRFSLEPHQAAILVSQFPLRPRSNFQNCSFTEDLILELNIFSRSLRYIVWASHILYSKQMWQLLLFQSTDSEEKGDHAENILFQQVTWIRPCQGLWSSRPS